MPGVIIIIIIIVLVLMMRKKKKAAVSDSKVMESEEFVLDSGSSEEKSSKLILGDAYKAKESVQVTNDNHVIQTIYMYIRDEDVWVCPNCEAENSRHSEICCVCSHSK